MKSFPPFDVGATPLAVGTTLIEASAGTGKTYAIAALFVRFVVEEDLTVGEILVTTYTKPATAELRLRIRTLLRAALRVFSGATSEHAFLDDLRERLQERLPNARARIERALRDFDEAAIHTVHGFCQQLLQDRAFESSLPFGAELITDQSAIVAEIADDFWRRTFYDHDPLLVLLAREGKVTPDIFADLLTEAANNPAIEVLPNAERFSQMSEDLARLFADLRRCWSDERESIGAFFAPGQKKWAKGNYNQGRPAAMEAALRALSECLSPHGARGDAFGRLEMFEQDKIKKATLGGRASPCHEFFQLCQKLRDLRTDFVPYLKSHFLEWGREELARRKLQRSLLSFDDLLTRLHAALGSPAGGALMKLVRSRFRAVLIDEFQDTDALQESIFRTLFADRKDGWLYLIGDPKQAIYGFRGADLFTYLAAAEMAGAHFTLETNRRSESELVAAVNHIFSRSPEAFALEGIAFRPAQAEGTPDETPLTVGGEKQAPFHIWWWNSPRAIRWDEADALLPRVTAAALAQMLAADVRIGTRPIQPRDFAVLTWSNAEAQAAHAALIDLGIAAVLHSTANVFHSAEARELRAILAAVAEPSRDALVRAALVTDLLGDSAFDIDALASDERRWETILLRFQEYHLLWSRAGFIQMFRRFLLREGIRSRLLGLRDGERRLTNLLHLGELLHCAAFEQRLGVAALIKWLGEQQTSKRTTAEEYELRLERDEEAVQIITMHKSKGLQFPVVFVPFAWKKAELRPDKPVLFHRSGQPCRLALDVGSRNLEEHALLARRERLAEQVRLLYVALTRAEHRCMFAWGIFNKHQASAAAWVLHPRRERGEENLAAFFEDEGRPTSAEMRAELDELARSSNGSILVEDLPPAAAPQRAVEHDVPSQRTGVRLFRGNIERDWRVASFSSLTTGRDAEQPDFDRLDSPLPAEPETALQGIHAFPRGVKAGICLHEIFENASFCDPSDWPVLIGRKLAAFGFDAPEYREAVRQTAARVVELHLAPGLALAGISNASRLNELEFYLPMSRLVAADLSALFAEQPGALGQLGFDPQRGYLKGFIDLVFEHEKKFYIVDWKSNWLGPRSDAYTAAALNAEMARHHYVLQYHLYAVALHRYLSLRSATYDYDANFGGIFYLFLRGLERDDPTRGVFHDRPTKALIDRLAGCFVRERA